MIDVRVFALTSVALGLLATVACEHWDPAGRTQTFALANAHAEMPCEGCHPTTPFTAEVQLCAGPGFVPPGDELAGCVACHECDRPVDHYVGSSCGQAGCHALVGADWVPDGAGTIITDVETCAGVCHNPFAPLREDAAPASDSHTAHLDGDTVSDHPIDCTECHGPEFGGDGHEDDGLLVVFADFSTAAGALAPSYDAGTKTCSDTYCHGGGMVVPQPDPVWGDAAYDVASCEPCHASPPPPPHITISACDGCHGTGDTVADIDTTLHIDGTCDGC